MARPRKHGTRGRAVETLAALGASVGVRAYDFAAIDGRKAVPRRRGYRRLDEMNRAIGKGDIYTTRMPRAGRQNVDGRGLGLTESP